MEIIVKVTGDIERDLMYCVTELDIVTCQEGQCLKEPEHWTPGEVCEILLKEYLTHFRNSLSLRPVPSNIWPYLLPRTGRTEPPQQQVTTCAAVEAIRQGGRTRKAAGRRY